MRHVKKQRGFTLIELMIVIAILAILLAIAIPAYQDYTTRSRVSECINLLSFAKSSVAQFAGSEGALPADPAAAGVLDPTTNVANCDSFSITAGTINVSYAGPGSTGVDFDLAPTLHGDGTLTWNCTATGQSRFAPPTCR